MGETVGQAVAKAQQGKDYWPYLSTYRDQFARILPAHLGAPAFMQLTASMMSRTADPQLIENANYNPGSFVAALFDCARLGHTPGTKQYYLIPFGSAEKGNAEVVGLEGYWGIKDRMYRSGQVLAVHAELVRLRDEFQWQPGWTRPPLHGFDPFADEDDRGPLRGVYAYAYLAGPSGPQISQLVVLGRKAIEARKKRSRGTILRDGTTNPKSPWVTDEEAMWRKTGLRDLERFVPTSSEWRVSVAPAAAVTVEQITPEQAPASGVLTTPTT